MFNVENIFLGDCVEVMREKVCDESVDLVVTSPPYDNLRSYGGGVDWNYDKFQLVANELWRVIKSGGVVVWIVNDATIDGSETGTSFRQALYFKEIGFNLHDTMIWEKISPFTHEDRYIANFEYMFILSKGKPKTTDLICDRRNLWGGTKVHGTLQQKEGVLSEINGKGKEIKEFGARLNTWDIPAEKNNKTGHPAVFPLRLAQDHIRTWSREGDLVLDPFMGSGTTGIAAHNLDRRFIGIEINKEYYEIAKYRVGLEQAQMSLF